MTPSASSSSPVRRGILQAFNERRVRDADAAIASTHDLDPRYAVRGCPRDPAYVLVPLLDEPHLTARLQRTSYGFVTRFRDQRTDPGLTRTKWYRDEDGMVRAHCRWDRGTPWDSEGVLVVAMIRDVREGDTLYMPDPLELQDRNIQIKRARGRAYV